jgi:nucleoside-diphosphate-sugar epimerase
LKVWVAGGTGVIGRRAVPALAEAGHEVTVLSRSPDRDARVRAMGATPARADLFDIDSVVEAAAGHEAIVNLATHIPPVSRAASARAWHENDRIRREGSANLVEAARRNAVGRFVQESITFPYADGADRWIDEDAPRVASGSTASVDDAESAVAGFSASDGHGVVLRFAQFYAPDSPHTRFFARAVRWRINPVPGDPDAYVSILGVGAAGRAVVAALEAPAGVYNVADDDPLTRRRLGTEMAAALGRKAPISMSGGMLARLNRAAEALTRSHRIDNRRFSEVTGWRPDHAGGAGLAGAVAAIAGR